MQVKVVLPRRPRVEMLPLIDMFFILLAFFIFGVFSMTMRQGMIVALPSASSAESAPEEVIGITVAPDGSLFLGEEPIVLAVLTARLRTLAADQEAPTVLLNADRVAAHGSVMGVLDAVRSAGIQRVSFQTEPER